MTSPTTAPPTDHTEQPTDRSTQSTLNLVDVESVRENGIIETSSVYAMLVKIEPRDWLTLSDEQRSTLYTKFLIYLRGIDFPTQLLTLTTRFDAEQYYDGVVGAESPTAIAGTHPLSPTEPPDHASTGASTDSGDQATATDRPAAPVAATDTEGDTAVRDVVDVDESAADETAPPVDGAAESTNLTEREDTTTATQDGLPPDGNTPAPDGGEPAGVDNLIVESPLLEYGRHAHVGWLRTVVTGGNVRDRQFFAAVAVPKGDQNDTDGRLHTHLATLRDALPGLGSTHHVTNEDAYLDEVWSRAHHVSTKLTRTDVGTTVLDARIDTLRVLYQHYRVQNAPIAFDHDALTRPDPTGLVDPDTGEDLDLDEVVADANNQATESELDVEDYPDRPHDEASRTPYDGRVEAEYVDRVEDSRLLSWYARHIGHIGTDARSLTPRAVYGGAIMFMVSLLLAGTALGGFLASARPGLVAPDSAIFWLVRGTAYGLAAGSLPVFLLSLVGLLPTGRRGRAAGLLGAGITGGAIALFNAAYPTRWTTELAVTTRVVKIYAVGLAVLVIAVAVAIRERRSALGTATTASPDDTDSGSTDDDTVTDSPNTQEPHAE